MGAAARVAGAVEHWPTAATTAVGAAAGAAGAGLSALGLNRWFLQQVNETLERGRAALFVVVSGGADPDRAIDALQPLGPRVLRTTLDPAVEQRHLAAFTEPAPPLDEAGDGGC